MVPFELDMRLAALQAAGIVRIVLGFDGGGDSGNWEESHGVNEANEEVKDMPEDVILALQERLGEHLPSFDGDGAFGEMVVDLKSGTVENTINERYTEYTTGIDYLRLEGPDVVIDPTAKEFFEHVANEPDQA